MLGGPGLSQILWGDEQKWESRQTEAIWPPWMLGKSRPRFK